MSSPRLPCSVKDAFMALEGQTESGPRCGPCLQTWPQSSEKSLPGGVERGGTGPRGGGRSPQLAFPGPVPEAILWKAAARCVTCWQRCRPAVPKKPAARNSVSSRPANHFSKRGERAAVEWASVRAKGHGVAALSEWGRILPQRPDILEKKKNRASFTEQQSLCQKHCCSTLPPTFLPHSLSREVRITVYKAVQDHGKIVKLVAQDVAQVK